MTHITAYLMFNGNARQAMTFYQECFGGDLVLQTVDSSPMADQMPAEARQNIMHASVTNGALELMASDMGHETPVQGNTISLSLHCSSEDEIRTFFSKLSSGGTVIQPLEDAPWGAIYGQLTDKFGIMWMLNYDKKLQA